MINNIGLPGLLLLAVTFAIFWIIPFWKILPKFGLPGPLALITVFPIAIPVLLWVLAFSTPVHDRNSQ